MTTIMPKSELARRALEWIDDQRLSGKDNTNALVQEALIRFNLGPKDEMFLNAFFKDTSKKQEKSPE
ncbi:hypothetical protein [Desulfobaculum bizertense]|uniref:Uncharacterized protein n=1 Tax=Desulfobaculum bizertense DSM 18034 TaxID=1121442 RepID=A0A1T4W1Z9_9BACT|nr:hypothetical protein [Desulfobaculum bizertense]UIJ38873.1 hypothetical protein LWC08_04685 [Desulfobaculum bizertense]SKA71276.1 hypothetical protein SAMN02745702_01446 [Desulfobaculum bizertense DSM 18034]